MKDLPTWAYSLISIIVSCILTTSIAFFVKRAIQRKTDKYDKLENLAKRQENYERKKEVKDIITESIKPLAEHIENIDNKLDQLKAENTLENKATTVMMRLKLMEWHDIYMSRGYCDSKERSTWEELFIKYTELGGNHFREYMDEIRKDIQNLPSEKSNKN